MTLLQRWSALLPGAEALGEDLLVRWSEPHRRYHTPDHLAAMLSVVDGHASEADDPDAVRLAVWFHDAVYDPRRTDNEDMSAALAARVLPAAGVPSERVAAVARLVRLTGTHDPGPSDRDGALLSDADLAVLAGEPDAYAAYAAAVREEYAHVPDEPFRSGRAAVLRSLVALPRLYHLPALREQWEDRARANLAAELRELEA
ncbi:MAG TPA: metal-dependent phosphohydrolase [Mycobacteriales bacterium]|nr:metal-dependent phosphohydrolase [Mycobacteriales bacterium]